MSEREELERVFIFEILRIVGPAAESDAYAVAPDTTDELLVARIERLREIPSSIGHDALIRLVGPRSAE